MRELKGWLKYFVSICLVGGRSGIPPVYSDFWECFSQESNVEFISWFYFPWPFCCFLHIKRNHQKIALQCLIVFFAVLAVLPPIYLMINNARLNTRFEMFDPILPIETILGLINIILIIEAVRRGSGTCHGRFCLGCSSVISTLLLIWGGIFYSKPMSLSEIVEICYMFTSEGYLWIHHRSNSHFLSLYSSSLVLLCKIPGPGSISPIWPVLSQEKSAGGPAKIAVISSGLFGSISGVAAANVYATGVFTIPLMKKTWISSSVCRSS